MRVKHTESTNHSGCSYNCHSTHIRNGCIDCIGYQKLYIFKYVCDSNFAASVTNLTNKQIKSFLWTFIYLETNKRHTQTLDGWIIVGVNSLFLPERDLFSYENVVWTIEKENKNNIKSNEYETIKIDNNRRVN